MAITAAEQYLLELINRARLDPAAEAARFGLDLNRGLAAGTIGTKAQQVLAHDSQLETAAQRHSDWMLATDTFSHTGAGGSSPTGRMRAAGYEFAGSWRSGENLAFSGTTGTLNLQAAITQHYDGLFRSDGHRANTLQSGFSEIGLAQTEGRFTSGGNTFNASMLTENFAKSGLDVFITGVAYRDLDSNRFYGMGEGRADIWVAADAPQVTTAAAGGYSTAVNADATTEVRIGQGNTTLATLMLDMSQGNVKLDIVTNTAGQHSLNLSGSAILTSGVGTAQLLGVGNLNLTGHSGANHLIGNKGANALNGAAGTDRLTGGDGADRFVFTKVSDSQAGAVNRDVITDMQRGQDKIDVSKLDADMTSTGTQDFSFIAKQGFDGDGAESAGQLRWYSWQGTTNGIVVSADLNGDGKADMQIMLLGITSLSASDFIF